ncbi:MAG: glycerophosphodiester phosphodiesterase [Actinomycetota bacterium]|nr:glycerophosphodiester phosphodiesterase [Actinomycetota bacterium]
MIQLRRPEGRLARVGHRGASALAPENTLQALELAVELGCDMLEFDVLDLADGTLVLAHSNDLREVSHGAARGRVRSRDLEGLRRVAPDLPTLDEALAFCADRLPGIGLQLDLKRVGIEAATVEALRRHAVLDRSWVSTFDARSLRRLAELEPELPRSYTLPRDRFGISKRGPLAPVVRGALGSIGASLPRRLPALLARARAVAATLHYSIASRAAIESAHQHDAAVYVWTVDDPRLAERLVRDGADGIITNDPRIFTMFTA